jgi:hypothetical protein
LRFALGPRCCVLAVASRRRPAGGCDDRPQPRPSHRRTNGFGSRQQLVWACVPRSTERSPARATPAFHHRALPAARGGAWEGAWAMTSEPVERGAVVAFAPGEARTMAEGASPARPRCVTFARARLDIVAGDPGAHAGPRRWPGSAARRRARMRDAPHGHRRDRNTGGLDRSAGRGRRPWPHAGPVTSSR